MSYELDGEPAANLFFPVGSPYSGTDKRRRARDTGDWSSPASQFQCVSIPTDTPKVTNTSYTLETDQAVQLGLNYIGTGNLDVDKKMKVFVREYAKYNTCESSDGRATLHYGAVWRATVLIDETDATGKLNFAMVAASATLKNISVEVSITHEGFTAEDQEAIDEASASAMDATANGLNVSSFVKFSEQVEKAVRAAMKAKVMTPLRYIAFQLHETDQLMDSIARTFALSYIARGAGCMAPIADFPVKSQRVEKAIRDTYEALSNKPCDTVDQESQMKAKRLLGGVTVRLPFWS